MELGKYVHVIFGGFLVWLSMAPGVNNPQYGDKLLAYMVTLLFSLIASSELMMTKPIAFFFTIGGVLAFCYVLARSVVIIRVKKE